MSGPARLLRPFTLLAGILASCIGATAQGPGGDPSGTWLVANGYARIKIVNCNGEFWGVVAWEQQSGVDSKNPDPNKRTRPTLGMPVLLAMRQSSATEWSGEIYNSRDGRTYKSSIRLVNPDTLHVQGCFLGFLCGGEDWKRVAGADSGARSDADICLSAASSARTAH
jgi:uncharacterized protein (DUF2147 family)